MLRKSDMRERGRQCERKREGKRQKKGKKKEKRKRKNTWTPFFSRSSQTNEAIKKCETSAVQSARQRSTVHKHNSGQRVEGVGMVRPS